MLCTSAVSGSLWSANPRCISSRCCPPNHSSAASSKSDCLRCLIHTHTQKIVSLNSRLQTKKKKKKTGHRPVNDLLLLQPADCRGQPSCFYHSSAAAVMYTRIVKTIPSLHNNRRNVWRSTRRRILSGRGLAVPGAVPRRAYPRDQGCLRTSELFE